MTADKKPFKPRAVRLSSGVVIVRETSSGLKFLLLRAFRNWDFAKGMVEAGEQPLEAALREVAEETAIVDLQFVWGEDYFETGPYSKSKVARYYIALTETTPVTLLANPILGRAEHNAFRWVTIEEARAMVSPRVTQVLEWAEGRLTTAGIRLA
jgi:8-oxo-dGTP pyrophosphatase MutT (NUDIX family)